MSLFAAACARDNDDDTRSRSQSITGPVYTLFVLHRIEVIDNNNCSPRRYITPRRPRSACCGPQVWRRRSDAGRSSACYARVEMHQPMEPRRGWPMGGSAGPSRARPEHSRLEGDWDGRDKEKERRIWQGQRKSTGSSWS